MAAARYPVKKSSLLMLSVILVLGACDQNSRPGRNPIDPPLAAPGQQPGNPNGDDPSKNLVAQFQIGNTSRVFSADHVETCSLTESARGTGRLLQISMKDGISNSSVLLKLTLGTQNESRVDLTSSKEGQLTLGVGGDERRYIFSSMENNGAARCQFYYVVQADGFNSSFRCDSLTNQMGEAQSATGQISCKFTAWRW
jgi:hypothetical protein